MEVCEPAVELREVSKKFGAVQAVDRASFCVGHGELFFLLGPSGCGKTTILRILAGLENPDSGAIFLQGRDASGVPAHKRGAPMVFQNYALWPHLNVSENIGFGLVERSVPRSERKGRIEQALAKVGLDGYGGRYPGQLSGGQQQRVALARALVLNPPIVLLDEPLSNLDAKLRMEMRDEIERLHKETEITFIYVTHDQAEALSLADRLAVMKDGRVCAIGKPMDLYHRPNSAFCAEFLGDSNILEGEVVSWESGCARVKSVLGEWVGEASGGWVPERGESVFLMVRPENIQPAIPGRGCGNSFKAALGSLRMTGSTVSFMLDAGGHALKAVMPNSFNVETVARSNTEWFVAVENTVVIPRSGSGRDDGGLQ